MSNTLTKWIATNVCGINLDTIHDVCNRRIEDYFNKYTLEMEKTRRAELKINKLESQIQELKNVPTATKPKATRKTNRQKNKNSRAKNTKSSKT